MNYKPWYALGELVDNALDSYLVPRNRKALRKIEGRDFALRIVVEVSGADDGWIRVWDNAAGINEKNYRRAFVTAEAPTDTAGLSQFGIGLKSASCWFAREWRVRSKALGENVVRSLEFDVPLIIRRNLESLQATVGPADTNAHFTEVKLWNLYKPPHTKTIDKMRRHLASMYRQFLRQGDVVIEFNGEPLQYSIPKVLVAPQFPQKGEAKQWVKDVEFCLPSGERVNGFVGIREKGSTKDAGLALFRRGRLIVGSDDESYRPHEIFGGTNSYRYQRIFGELSLDDFDVSHTKDGFIWGDREAVFLAQLRKALDAKPLPLLQQAEQYRARQAGEDAALAAARALDSTVAALPHAEGTIEEQAGDFPEEEFPPEVLPATKLNAQRKLNLKVKGETWEVALETTIDPAATEWLEIRDKAALSRNGVRKIGIQISLSHPFMQRFGGTTTEDMEGLIRVAVALAIAETTAREAGAKMCGTIRRNLNELLGGALAQA